MTSRDHADAFMALLGTNPNLTPLRGQVPAGQAPPYVVVYFADDYPADEQANGLAGSSSRYRQWAICHGVGETEDAALIVSDQVAFIVLDATLAVAGRVCWPIRRESGQPVRRDESTGIAVHDKVDVYRIESMPA